MRWPRGAAEAVLAVDLVCVRRFVRLFFGC